MSAATAAVAEWVQKLGRREPPVLARTVRELAVLASDEDNATPQRVSDIVLHDPLMTLKVLQYIQLNRHASQHTEITTIAHALMMLGLGPFFRHFRRQQTLESMLESWPPALQGALSVASRARHAALYARDWAAERHDIEVDEVMIAALLHDVAEMLLWCTAPIQAMRIQDLQRADHALRSEEAQHAVLGVNLVDVQLSAAKEWRLPAVLHHLMDDHHARRPREANVILAAAVARHSARGWNDAALAHDYEEIGRMLGLTPGEARRRVIRVALAAAQDWSWYGVPPAAALLPLITLGDHDEKAAAGGAAAKP
jgi:HD-like signal output (HDOD) protein